MSSENDQDVQLEIDDLGQQAEVEAGVEAEADPDGRRCTGNEEYVDCGCPGLRSLQDYIEYKKIAMNSVEPGWMNHGYSPAKGDDIWKHQRALYMEVSRGIPSGSRLLEVGCGRGAGLSALTEAHNLSAAVGLDIIECHVSFARRRYPQLEFVQGSAENLPFPSAAFDVILTIESSHLFPSIVNFLHEAARLLKPGGTLLYADIVHINAIPILHQILRYTGFMDGEFVDITSNVREACQATKAIMSGHRDDSVCERYYRRAISLEKEYSSQGVSRYVMGRFRQTATNRQ